MTRTAIPDSAGGRDMDLSTGRTRTYVLMTAAYNEEAHIERTIQAVLLQTIRPCRWVIVSDGSSDATNEIVAAYAKEHAFIRFVPLSRPPGRSFRSKVVALQKGAVLLQDVRSEYIGNLDADVSVEPTYFAELIARFEAQSDLGIAGGNVLEEQNGHFIRRGTNRTYSVAHAAQLVRRECYDSFGGYAVLEYGGEDWHAQVSAQMKGWKVYSFPELAIFHHRHTGKGDNLLRHKFRQGRMDYAFGSHPVFEFLKCAQRVTESPVFFGAAARLTGFLWSSFRRERRPFSQEFIAFLRREQCEKLVKFTRWPFAKTALSKSAA